MSLENLVRGMWMPPGEAAGWCSYMSSLCRALIYMEDHKRGMNVDPLHDELQKVLEAVYVRVVELGCGACSSPFLASLGSPFSVRAWEEDVKWLPKGLDSGFYEAVVGAPPPNMLRGLRMDVVLVDHGVEARARDLALLSVNKNCGLVVVHDWDVPVYQYGSIIPLFKHRVEDRSMFPYTAILSNTVDLSTWKGYVPTVVDRLTLPKT